MSSLVVTPIRRRALKRSRAAIGTLADAFYDDPLYSFLLPDERRRRSNTAAIMRLLFRLTLPYGGVYAAERDGQIAGAIALVPPGKYPLPTLRLAVAAGAMAVTPSLWGRSMGILARRGRPYMEAVDRLHYPDPHWYLAIVGVGTAHQGKGAGAALLQTATELASQSRHPLYLETNNERNIPLYRRYGFEVTTELPVPGGGPPIWTMLRKP